MTTDELWERIRGELDKVCSGIEDGLTTEISAVRFDFAHPLRTEVGAVGNELRDFRGGLETFRDDALTHFDRIYGYVDAQATEHQAVCAAVERLEKRGGGTSN